MFSTAGGVVLAAAVSIGEVSRVETLREEARNGRVSESVRDWVIERIALEHPSLVAACKERERAHWEQT